MKNKDLTKKERKGKHQKKISENEKMKGVGWREIKNKRLGKKLVTRAVMTQTNERCPTTANTKVKLLSAR